MAGERAACLLDQASIAKVAKSMALFAYPAQRSRTFCPSVQRRHSGQSEGVPMPETA